MTPPISGAPPPRAAVARHSSNVGHPEKGYPAWPRPNPGPVQGVGGPGGAHVAGTAKVPATPALQVRHWTCSAASPGGGGGGGGGESDRRVTELLEAPDQPGPRSSPGRGAAGRVCLPRGIPPGEMRGFI